MKGSLICIGFHSILNNEDELKSGLLFPFQLTTVKGLRETIEPLLDKNYSFIKPSDITEGLDNDKNHCLLTFDDGYFNGTNALSVLKEFNIPAVFFVSTGPVITGNAFWWDVVFRFRNKQGKLLKTIKKEISSLEILRNADKERYLFDNFGEKSLIPVSDLDRPFNKDELNIFSSENRVVIGNHSTDHTPLTTFSAEEAKSHIKQAQTELEKITGKVPDSISYPHGKFSEEIISKCKCCGLKVGISCKKGANELPLHDFFKIERFFSLLK